MHTVLCAYIVEYVCKYIIIHFSIIRALLNHQKDCILDEDEDGNTPLHLASINGYHKSVKVLLDAQADFDAK